MNSAWAGDAVPTGAAPCALWGSPHLISGESLAHRAQLVDETLLLRHIQGAKRMSLNVVAQRPQLWSQPMRSLGEVQAIGTAVGRLAAPLHPARFLHAVDEPSEGDRRDLEMLGERRLARAFATKQCGDQRPLGSSQTQTAGTLIDTLRHEAGEILDQAT